MKRSINRARGETALEAGGVTYRLCLTLGALAEIEEALGVTGFEALGERLAAPRGNDLIAVLAALLRGGGHDLDTEDVRRLPVEMADAVRAIAAALNAAAPEAE
ncbi:MAG: gene transfer agent family protein [Alphaproteobacteria bacterium]